MAKIRLHTFNGIGFCFPIGDGQHARVVDQAGIDRVVVAEVLPAMRRLIDNCLESFFALHPDHRPADDTARFSLDSSD